MLGALRVGSLGWSLLHSERTLGRAGKDPRGGYRRMPLEHGPVAGPFLENNLKSLLAVVLDPFWRTTNVLAGAPRTAKVAGPLQAGGWGFYPLFSTLPA